MGLSAGTGSATPKTGRIQPATVLDMLAQQPGPRNRWRVGHPDQRGSNVVGLPRGKREGEKTVGVVASLRALKRSQALVGPIGKKENHAKVIEHQGALAKFKQAFKGLFQRKVGV